MAIRPDAPSAWKVRAYNRVCGSATLASVPRSPARMLDTLGKREGRGAQCECGYGCGKGGGADKKSMQQHTMHACSYTHQSPSPVHSEAGVCGQQQQDSSYMQLLPYPRPHLYTLRQECVASSSRAAAGSWGRGAPESSSS